MNLGKTNQNQVSGDGSANFQAAHDLTINHGLSYSEARTVALDVFRAEFSRLSGEALNVARDRIEAFTDKAIAALESAGTEKLNAIKDPDFQGTLFEAQRAAARHNDPTTTELLIDTLKQRAKEQSRSRRQLVLNESVTVIGQLTSDELAALSLVFTLRHTRAPWVDSKEKLVMYVRHSIAPFLNDLPQHESAYQHLEYLRCGQIQISQMVIEEIFARNYPGLFSRGFLLSDHPALQHIPGMLTTCINDSARLQFTDIDHDAIAQRLQSTTIQIDQQAELVQLAKNRTMPQEEVSRILENIVPGASELITLWNGSLMKNFSLTAVGIAIGHANLRRVTGDRSNLSIWIR